MDSKSLNDTDASEVIEEVSSNNVSFKESADNKSFKETKTSEIHAEGLDKCENCSKSFKTKKDFKDHCDQTGTKIAETLF